MKAVILLGFLAVAFAQQTAFFCEVAINNFCSGNNAPSCPGTPTFGGSRGPARMSGSYAFSSYNIISFKDFNGVSDTEGRVAAAGNVVLGAGYSIGAEINTMGVGAIDEHVDYSLIAGGSLTWPSGALYPMASNNFHLAQEEHMFVGGSLTNVPDYLSSSRQSDSALGASLEGSFSDALAYYYNLQQAFAAATVNTVSSVQSNGDFNIVCNNIADTSYVVSVDGSDFNRVRNYVFSSSCATTVQVVFNIQGTGTVYFQGNNIAETRRAEIILFNILGSARTITVTGASVRGNILAPYNTLNTVNGGYIQGFQVYGDVANSRQINRVACRPPAAPIHPENPEDLCPGFEAACAGLDIVLPSPADQTPFSFRDCNVISFNDFNANTGDVQGRVCVARDFSVGNGYSVGYELSTLNNVPQRHAPVALLAGRNCVWQSGSVHPSGNNIPNPGLQEDIFCGGTFQGSDDLRARVTQGPCGTAGCLDSLFQGAKGCYSGYSTVMAAKPDNVDTRVQWSGLFLSCRDSSSMENVFSVTPETMSQYTYIVTENCNFQAQWIMNVRGSGDVTLTGQFLAVPDGAVVVNIIGSRTVFVTGIRLNAHLLAVDATLNQTGGVIVGKVVANNVAFSLQINLQDTCAHNTTVQVPIIPLPPNVPNTPTIPVTTGTTPAGSSSSSSSGSASSSSSSGTDVPSSTSTGTTPLSPPITPNSGCLTVYSRSSFRNGDSVTFVDDQGSSAQGTIVSNTDNTICVSPPATVPRQVYAGRGYVGYATIQSNDGRRTVANPVDADSDSSSATSTGFALALFAIVAMFF